MTIPIFPLPNVVLFPNVFLPLHIFEPRYRQMFGEALAGDRTIGMVLLQPGYEAEYDGRPPIYGTGCSGLITHSERLDDGRYNVVLRGIEKFTIAREEEPAAGRLYRTAVISSVDDTVLDGERDSLRRQRRRLEEILAPLWATGLQQHLPAAMPDEDLINALAQYLEFEPIEKLALLQQRGALARCTSMIELLEMKTFSTGTGNQEPGVVH
ncbi:MAG TPA: LON peptidase substrate-binding domain-containing protein [Vicinamibacterales bacterium]|nr:LON peptidase substrate-binding domain-containing protein [Vicinamibacterales bacterium]